MFVVKGRQRTERITFFALHKGGVVGAKDDDSVLSQWTACPHVAWHNGAFVKMKEEHCALFLWMVGSRAEVRDWIEELEIPLCDGGAHKGRYVGFRNDAVRGMDRFWRMPW